MIPIVSEMHNCGDFETVECNRQGSDPSKTASRLVSTTTTRLNTELWLSFSYISGCMIERIQVVDFVSRRFLMYLHK